MGKTASELERQGIQTERGEHNRAVAERNARRERGRHIRNLDERLTSRREQDPTPTFDEWMQTKEPQKEQSRGLERGR
jgi:hypothetical protein